MSNKLEMLRLVGRCFRFRGESVRHDPPRNAHPDSTMGSF